MERSGIDIVRTVKPRTLLAVILCKYIFGIFSLSEEEKARLKSMRDIHPIALVARKILEWQERGDFKQSRQGKAKYFNLLKTLGYNGNKLEMLDGLDRSEVITKLQHYILPDAVEDYGEHRESAFVPDKKSQSKEARKTRGRNDTGSGFISGGTQGKVSIDTLERLKAFVRTLTSLELLSKTNSITARFDDELQSGVTHFERAIKSAMTDQYSARSVFYCGAEWARRMKNLLVERSANIAMSQVLQTLICVCTDEYIEIDNDAELVPYGDLVREIQALIDSDVVDGTDCIWVNNLDDGAVFHLSEEVKVNLVYLGLDAVMSNSIGTNIVRKGADLLNLVAMDVPFTREEIVQLVTILNERHNTAIYLAKFPGNKSMMETDEDFLNLVVDVYAKRGYSVAITKDNLVVTSYLDANNGKFKVTYV